MPNGRCKAEDLRRVEVSRALDPGYFPVTLEDAIDIIKDLRARLATLQGGFDIAAKQHHMVEREWLLYSALKEHGCKTVPQILTLLWGNKPPRTAVDAIRQYILGIRIKLPSDEVITSVYGRGYAWQKLSRNNGTSANERGAEAPRSQQP
jgi:hypothetical protein